ncbi:hypothetical protein ACFPN1_11155 [Lysobacter yangpyeongensis]|uniref:Uncharacterized protein n=1 Tax=Lysobacter yangpyeongensis TaxID=346182 RepID=A0ABW0SNF9_9GAMM
MSRRLFALTLSIVLAWCPAAFAASAAAPLAPDRIKVGELLRDVMRVDASGDSIEMVLWLPVQYVEASLAQNKADEKGSREIVSVFGQYTVVAALQGTVGTLGNTYTSEQDLRGKLRIVDATGHSYAPIPADKLDKKMSRLIAILQPFIKQTAGEVGDNLALFVFPGKGSDGKRIADAMDNGLFTVQIDETAHRFRLPLGSLLASRIDADTGESFPGSYNFNPYTGAPLTAAP